MTVNELPDGRIIIYNTMPDITMCSDIYCELRKTCHRYNNKPGKNQSYFMNVPRKEDGSCDYYWGDSSENILDQLKDIVK